MHIFTTSIISLLAVLPNLALAFETIDPCDYGLIPGHSVKYTKACTLGAHSIYHCGTEGGTLGNLWPHHCAYKSADG